MKIIQTDSYLKKQAQFNDLPGDPSLPPGVTNRMIEQHSEGGDVSDLSKQSGDYEKKVNWAEETRNLINAGYDVMGLPQQGLGEIIAYYEYDAEIYGSEVTISNIRLLDIKVLRGNQYQGLTVSDHRTKEGLFDGMKDEIAEREKTVIQEQQLGQDVTGPDTREEMY